MSYYNLKETESRIHKVKGILETKNLDAALIYYDELNIANGWYLTGWCPQFESGAVLVPAQGQPLLLGGPESEPFAAMSSAIKETRNFPVFMVPDEEYPNATIIDFKMLNDELKAGGTTIRRLGFVGTATIPHLVYKQLAEGFAGTEFVDITEEYEALRVIKSPWEIENLKKSGGFDRYCV